MKITDPVSKCMTRDLITFSPGKDISEVIQIFTESKISGAPVVDERGTLIGIISEKDCIRGMMSRDYYNRLGAAGTVSDFMTAQVKTLSVDTHIRDAAFEFLHSHYRRFPVLEDNRLVGQVSRRDVLNALMEMEEEVDVTPTSWEKNKPQP